VPYSWSFWGGVLEHADHQARALRSLGVDARLILGNDPPGRLTKLLHPKEGRHAPPPEYVIPVGRSVIVPANASLPNIVLSPNALVRVKRILEQERFDVVHVHEPLAPILSAFALLIAECPTVSTSHAAGERLGWYPLGKVMWGVAAERIDYRIAVSDAARRAAEPYVGGPIEVIPNGIVLPEWFDAGNRDGNVVFIGRNEQRKGLHVLLRAWPQISARTDARLRVVGADPLSVRWLARREGLSLERVDLLGGLDEEELTHEVELLEDEPRRRRLGEGARKVAERYSWDPIARRLLSVYEELASQGVRVRAAA
jgi:phosphatidylinositol alpha-mannosyltransferase